MDSRNKIERCKLISITENSASKRQDRTDQKSTFSYSMPPIHHVSRGHHAPSVHSQPLSSSSNLRVSNKFTKLHRLRIPETPSVSSVQRYPTTLQAGSLSKSRVPVKTVEQSYQQELFFEPSSSTVPGFLPLSLPQPAQPTVLPSGHLSANTKRPSQTTGTFASKDTNGISNKPLLPTTNTNAPLVQMVTTLYEQTSTPHPAIPL